VNALRVGEELWDGSEAAAGGEVFSARCVVSWAVSKDVLYCLDGVGTVVCRRR